ncbi:MAG: hypothetical protein DMG13_30515 [Acidobacteria bacterium]|nr:MAG: hypothetical protein DMG13_30515 [Acidobacteriota bacterium]
MADELCITRILLLVFLTKFFGPLTRGFAALSQRERDILQACPSPSGTRWPEGPDEGFGWGFAAL